MKRLSIVLIFLCFLFSSSIALGVNFDLNYYNLYTDDYHIYDFILANDVTDVKLYTDSYSDTDTVSGYQGFDPILALWESSGNIAFNDDNSSVNPATQSIFDSGIELSFLASGDYSISVSEWPNYPDTSGTVSSAYAPSGFGYSTNSWVHIVFESNDVSSPVPEPATMFLLGSGLVGLTGFRRKFRK